MEEIRYVTVGIVENDTLFWKKRVNCVPLSQFPKEICNLGSWVRVPALP